MKEGLKIGGHFKMECFGKDGVLKWEDEFFPNTVVNVGLQHVLDVTFSALAEESPWYLGLTDGTPTVNAADTSGSHVGWTEVTDYTGTRKEWVEVRSGQASVAVYAIDGTATVGGAFLDSDTSGTAGVLMSAGALTGGDRSVINGDTLNLTYVFAAADA